MPLNLTQSARKIEAGELETFKALRLEALRTEPNSFGSRFEDWENRPQEDWLLELRFCNVFAAFHGNEPVGLMGMIPLQVSEEFRSGKLVMVYIQPSERGTGVASLLLKELVVFTRTLNLSQMSLTVGKENHAAIRFYQKSGFVEVNSTSNPNGSRIEEILMIRSLTD
ncbi:hypothetical protein A9Q83_09155 [Alphaproteobacteria bacterium 46_93_T64]|nr:hypothetical protein A9Q83_09155 [Alphaproteobacteria bacterium 46_93_T64]